MNSVLKRLSTTFFISLIFISTVFGQDFSTQKSSIKTSPVNFVDLKINFPDVEGWQKGNVTTYPTPALGYSINYESEKGGRVTVYVYNNGNSNILTGTKDKLVKDEITNAKNQIFQVQQMGVYQNVKELKNKTLALGGDEGKVESLFCQFTMSAKGQDLTSEIYVFGYKKHFIKIRATRPYEKEETKNVPLNNLMTAFDKLFSDDGTLALTIK